MLSTMPLQLESGMAELLEQVPLSRCHRGTLCCLFTFRGGSRDVLLTAVSLKCRVACVSAQSAAAQTAF